MRSKRPQSASKHSRLPDPSSRASHLTNTTLRLSPPEEQPDNSDYPEATRTAQAFVKAAPERLVWGSDWPHPSEQNGTLPDDALLFDLLAVWAPEETTRKRILVDNPENLYGFAKAA